MKMPGISTNVEIWAKTGVASLFFLPEGVLLYKEDLCRAVSYDFLDIFYRAARCAERRGAGGRGDRRGDLQYVKADGSPDIRYPPEPEVRCRSLRPALGDGHSSRHPLPGSTKAAAVTAAGQRTRRSG